MKSELLVAIINNKRDFHILCEHSWYRIPVDSVHKWLRRRWPPEWIAFYQTKVFEEEAYSIRYYSEVAGIRQANRRDLFPTEPPNCKQCKIYYQLTLKPLQVLKKPIFSRRRRRIIFISSTMEKFIKASEINDLYDDSPLEEHLWCELKRLEINAERQELVAVQAGNYFLDFAVYCAEGKLNLEVDGDTWHSNKQRAGQDNLRDNALKTKGWRVLRFNTHQVQEQMSDYCVPIIVENINGLGGLIQDDDARKMITLKTTSNQLDLFHNDF